MKYSILLFLLCLSLFNCKNGDTQIGQKPVTGTIFMAPERIPLEAGGFYNAERGMIFLPTNRSKEDTDVLALEIYRFPAKDKSKASNPPIYFLHGGPSFGGLEKDLEELGLFEKRWEGLTEIADVIVIGQRGIGASKPNTIIDNTVVKQAPDQPIDFAKRNQAYTSLLAKEKKAWEDLGIDLSGYTVLEAVEDLNDVRKAFGHDKITIWAGSFGSHWGMAFMRKYPQYVERAIMRGMEGPDHTYDHPGHLWNAYKRIAEEAENSKELAAFIPKGGLIKAIEVAIKKAEENPQTIKVGDQNVLINGNVVRSYARGYTRHPRTFPACVIDLYNGNYETVAKDIAESYKEGARRFRTASYWMLDCGSGITPERLATHESDPAFKILPQVAWIYKKGCPVWESDLGDDFRQNFETEIPTLIVQGTWDTSTPYENAVELVPFFKNSKFITVKRGRHGTIRQASNFSESFKNAVYKFAETGDFSELPDSLELPVPDWKMPLQK